MNKEFYERWKRLLETKNELELQLIIANQELEEIKDAYLESVPCETEKENDNI